MKRFLLALVLYTMASTAFAAPAPTARVVKVSAKKFEFSPSTIELKVGEHVVIELTTSDRKHGFSAPDFNVETVILPGKIARITLTPDKPGTYVFHCNMFCGSGHEDMTGTIVVTE